MTQLSSSSICEPGTMIGEYTVHRHLASGGMADVYLVQHADDPHLVALKWLRSRHRSDPEYRQMLVDEANIMKQLSHPNVVDAYDTGCVDDGYFTMEYVHGVTLAQTLRGAITNWGGLPVDVTVSIMSRLACALHSAHEQCDADGTPLGVIHRDVSMANVLVGFDGTVKLADFGVARASCRDKQTAANQIKGKLGYMSPEQVLGQPLDRRSDVFALGIVLHELLTGKRLFRAESDYKCLRKIVSDPIPGPSSIVETVPAGLDAVAMRALARAPGDRYQTAQEFLAALADAVGEDVTRSTDTITSLMAALFGDTPGDESDESCIVTAGDCAPAADDLAWIEAHDTRVVSCSLDRESPATKYPDLWDTADGYLADQQYSAAVTAYRGLIDTLAGDANARAAYYEAIAHLAQSEGRTQVATRYFRWASDLGAQRRPRAETHRGSGARVRHAGPRSSTRRMTLCLDYREQPLAAA